MVGIQRTPIQIERDRQSIAELMCKGWAQNKIADYLEVSPATVNRDLKAIKEAWQSQAIADRGQYVNQEMQRLAMVESEYWAAWERSQGSQTTITEVDPASSVEAQMEAAIGGSSTKTSRRTQQQVGNPQFLGGVVKVIETRCKLLGLFPETGAAGPQLVMDDRQLAVLSQLMQESKNG
jgi:predicted transcriptional regulator